MTKTSFDQRHALSYRIWTSQWQCGKACRSPSSFVIRRFEHVLPQPGCHQCVAVLREVETSKGLLLHQTSLNPHEVVMESDYLQSGAKKRMSVVPFLKMCFFSNEFLISTYREMRRIIDVPHEGLCDECKVVLLEGAAVRQVNFSVGVFDAVGLNLITSVRAVTLTATFVSGIWTTMKLGSPKNLTCGAFGRSSVLYRCSWWSPTAALQLARRSLWARCRRWFGRLVWPRPRTSQLHSLHVGSSHRRHFLRWRCSTASSPVSCWQPRRRSYFLVRIFKYRPPCACSTDWPIVLLALASLSRSHLA